MAAMAIFMCRPNSHPFQERHVSLHESIKIGRSVARARPAPNNAIFDCKVLSRNHALLWYENGKVSYDLFSGYFSVINYFYFVIHYFQHSKTERMICEWTKFAFLGKKYFQVRLYCGSLVDNIYTWDIENADFSKQLIRKFCIKYKDNLSNILIRLQLYSKF